MKTVRSNAKLKQESKSGRQIAARAESRAKNLRDVAAEVFLEFGFEKAKLSEIAERAGASKETLYAQYRNKDELFREVIKHYLNDAFKPFALLSSPHLPPLEPTLRDIAFGLLTYILLEDSQQLSDVIYQEASRFPDLAVHFYEASYGSSITQLSSFFDAHIRAGNLADRDTTVMARQFLELSVSTPIIKSLLYVERSQSPTQRREWVSVAVGSFLHLFRVS